jgi:hypothetical protein
MHVAEHPQENVFPFYATVYSVFILLLLLSAAFQFTQHLSAQYA